MSRSAKKGSAGRRTRIAVISAVLAALGTLGIATPASAATTVGVCRLVVEQPHASSHVNGRISSSGTMTCSIGMPEIYISATLEKSGGPSWSPSPTSYLNTSAGRKYQNVASTTCSQGPGTFRVRVYFSFRSPANISPAAYADTHYSNWVSVACGVSRADEPSLEEVTMTFMDDGTMSITTDETAVLE